MYHTFQASTAATSPTDADPGKPIRSSGSRRISTSNACVECRRRKIRCDGTQPCGQCQWYQHPEACNYSKPAQRVVPSRKLVDKLSANIDQYHSLFSRLFPGKDLDSLVALPREELINIALTLPAPATSPANSIIQSVIPEATPRSDGAESLEALEQAPDQDPEIDEAKRHRDKVQGISDDVNGLSLSVDRQSSYVGVSSITAALKVIFKTAPVARPFIAHSHTETALPSRSNTPPPESFDLCPTYLPPASVGHALIESYFQRIHVLMPMVDEQQFWHTWLYGERRDSPWLALLNMVFALGCLAGSTSDSDDHIAYFQRARKHLDLETFGSGNLLVLQALGLLSGYYLHWLNRPNEANCLMGATLRMATALGLHREYNEGQAQSGSNGIGNGSNADAIPAEIRRRTWWSLFCLDAWGSTTTGRPSLGRLGPGITVQGPKTLDIMNNLQYQQSLKMLPLIHNISFCKLATRIQDQLACSPLLKFEDLVSLDSELVRWHEDLPTILLPSPANGQPNLPNKRSNSIHQQSRPKSVTPSSASATTKNPFDFSQPPERDNQSCPEFLKTPRAIMHWRYQNLRMLIHRPFLLATALRRTSYMNLSAEEKVAVGRCRIIASQSIADITNTCSEELIAGWNAVWLMYQAVMVPLVSIFSHLSLNAAHSISMKSADNGAGNDASAGMTTGSEDDVEKWRHQIETAIKFFDRMTHYSVAAKKSKDVVARLYEASKQLSEYNAQQLQQQHSFYQQRQQLVAPSQSFDGIPPGPGTFNIPSNTNGAPYGNANGTQNPASSTSMWGLSPNGDAAMNSFWDDMMWDTFPGVSEMPDTTGLGFGVGEFEWMPVGMQHPPDLNGNGNGQTWEYPQYDQNGEQR